MTLARLKTALKDSSEAADRVAQKYAVAISPHIAENLSKAAIAKQYIPDIRELITAPDEDTDPIGDDAHTPVKGIVHRYPNRALLKITNICAVYCRFCFRREKVGPGSEVLKVPEIEAALAYLENTPEIWEVILTGGDPLILAPAKLQKILERLDGIKHIQTVRIHTRIPVADPDKITPEMIKALQTRNPLTIVLHVNHADELTKEVTDVLRDLHQKSGAMLLSQSVLLKNVNDNADTLRDLFEKLIQSRVKPYYLHHLDKAPGTAHFRVPLGTGMKLYKDLQKTLSGIVKPNYILDIPGGFGKIPINADYVAKNNDGSYTLTDHKGQTHNYHD